MTAQSSTNIPLLFTPTKLRGLEIRNRIMASPMCQYHSDDGGPNDWHMMHLGRLAIGGCGIVFGEETAVEPDGRKTHSCAGLYNQSHIAAYRRLTDMIKQHGAVPAIQLGHSGRKGSCHGAIEDWRPLTAKDAKDGLPPWQIMTPSAAISPPRPIPPKEMDQDDIKRVIEAFRTATKRSIDAGYDIVEIHGAHGYLIHQFLSSSANQRDDTYGGSLENRLRYPLEIFDAVKAVVPADMPVLVRVSASDWVDGGWDVEQTIVFARALDAVGCASLHVSSGGNSLAQKINIGYGYQTDLAKQIRDEVAMPIIAVGMITDPVQAETIIRTGQADMVALAREFLRDPHWTWRAAKALRATSSVPPQYQRAVSFD